MGLMERQKEEDKNIKLNHFVQFNQKFRAGKTHDHSSSSADPIFQEMKILDPHVGLKLNEQEESLKK